MRKAIFYLAYKLQSQRDKRVAFPTELVWPQASPILDDEWIWYLSHLLKEKCIAYWKKQFIEFINFVDETKLKTFNVFFIDFKQQFYLKSFQE